MKIKLLVIMMFLPMITNANVVRNEIEQKNISSEDTRFTLESFGSESEQFLLHSKSYVTTFAYYSGNWCRGSVVFKHKARVSRRGSRVDFTIGRCYGRRNVKAFSRRNLKSGICSNFLKPRAMSCGNDGIQRDFD